MSWSCKFCGVGENSASKKPCLEASDGLHSLASDPPVREEPATIRPDPATIFPSGKTLGHFEFCPRCTCAKCAGAGTAAGKVCDCGPHRHSIRAIDLCTCHHPRSIHYLTGDRCIEFECSDPNCTCKHFMPVPYLEEVTRSPLSFGEQVLGFVATLGPTSLGDSEPDNLKAFVNLPDGSRWEVQLFLRKPSPGGL